MVRRNLDRRDETEDSVGPRNDAAIQIADDDFEMAPRL
jgi:hypothetical protein